MSAPLRTPSTIGRAALVAAVLTLGAFNLAWGLGSESLTEWDESLYAHSALEMLASGNLAATTIFGELDYFNSKPPLNVWLLATSLRVFGPSLLSLRLAAIASAWLTIVVILIWGWRRVSPVAGLFAALVLSTSFGFLQLHSGRSANPDALLTLLLVLIVVTLDAAAARPWRRVWLGPLLAGVFLLKGMAVVLPLLLIAVIETRWRVPPRDRWVPLAIAAVLAVLPAGAWVVARWRVDRELFFGQMFFQDFIGLSTTALANQSGSPLFYLNVLLEHQYEWLIAAVAVGILYRPASWRSSVQRLAFWRGNDRFITVVGCWIAIAVVVPSMMQTKAAWYLNPVYPVFALAVGAALSYGFTRTGAPRDHRALLVAVIVMATLVAESKLFWYSNHYRTLDLSSQGVLLAEADRLRGARVYNTSWDLADLFVVRGLVQAEPETITVGEFVQRSGPRDFIVLPSTVTHPLLIRIAVKGNYGLYQLVRMEAEVQPR